MTSSPPFKDQKVEEVFESFPDEVREPLLRVRALIFDTAAAIKGVGEIEEALKWGQPSYLTPKTKSGSTLRLGTTKSGAPAVFTHCQTSIMSDFRMMFEDAFTIDGNRALHLSVDEDLPLEKLEFLVRRALAYHLSK